MRRTRSRRGNVDFGENKKIYITITVIAVIISIISVTLLIIKQSQTNKEALIQEQIRQEEISKVFEESQQEIEEITNGIKSSKVKIKILGNILCENAVLNSAYNSQTNEYDFTSIFTNLKEYVSDADLVVGNMETNFLNEKYTSHNSPRSLIAAIKELNIKTLNIANNQNLSDGVEGLISTKKALIDEGIDTYGTSIGEDDSKILIKEVNGIKIGFVSYITKIDDGIEVNEDNIKYVNYYSPEQVDKDFEYLKEQEVEYIIANIHTGSTQHRITEEEHEEINNKLIESGADVIIGTHQNDIGKLEIRQNADGKNVLIANSMGHILSENTNVALMLEIQIIRSESAGGTILSKVVYTPTYTLKSVKPYQIFNLRETIKIYENEDDTIVDKNTYNKMKQELEKVETLISQ